MSRFYIFVLLSVVLSDDTLHPDYNFNNNKYLKKICDTLNVNLPRNNVECHNLLSTIALRYHPDDVTNAETLLLNDCGLENTPNEELSWSKMFQKISFKYLQAEELFVTLDLDRMPINKYDWSVVKSRINALLQNVVDLDEKKIVESILCQHMNTSSQYNAAFCNLANIWRSIPIPKQEEVVILRKYGAYKISERCDIVCEANKELTCAKSVRYGLESFKKAYLLNVVEETKQRNSIISRMQSLLEDRRRRFTSIINNIQVFKSVQDKASTLTTTVDNLKKLVINVGNTNSESSSHSANDITKSPSNLREALLQLLAESDPRRLTLVRSSQESFWDSFCITDQSAIDEIKSLSADLTEQLLDTHLMAFVPALNHQKFVRDALAVGRFVFHPVTERYLECIWTMYSSLEIEIDNIKDGLKREWPELEEARRNDRFCFAFSKLYEYVSSAVFHSPSDYRVPQDCRPDTAFYVNYLTNLAAKENEGDFVIVALLLRGLPLPTRTTAAANGNQKEGA